MTTDRVAAVRGWVLTVAVIISVVVALGIARTMHGGSSSPAPPTALTDPGLVGVQAIYVYQMTLYDRISHRGELGDENDVRALYRLMPPSCARAYGDSGYQYFIEQSGASGDWWMAMSLAAAVRPLGVAPEPEQISIDPKYHDATVAPPGHDPNNLDTRAPGGPDGGPTAIGGGWGSWSRYIYIGGRWYDDRPSVCP